MEEVLLIVSPILCSGGIGQGFKLFWGRKSKGEARKSQLSTETVALIKQIAVENRRWGAKRIRGELLKLGIRVNKGPSVAIYARRDVSVLTCITGKFGTQFERVAEGSGINVIHTSVQAPKANAIYERFVGSVRREILDHILILSGRHPSYKIKEYSPVLQSGASASGHSLTDP